VPIVNYVDIPHILNYLVRFLFKYIYNDLLKLHVRLIPPTTYCVLIYIFRNLVLLLRNYEFYMKQSSNNLQSRMSGESPNVYPESKSQGLGIVVYNILRDCLKPVTATKLN